jgi:CheY-like chemotaxis protein
MCDVYVACGQEKRMSPVALVVDDSMLIRHTVCQYLQERGFEVQSATNGVDALDVLSQMPAPDLIVTDLNMPKMNGSELITALKANPETANIPVVIIAAKRTSTDGEMETRAQYVIYKDIAINEQLEKAITALTSHGKK